MLWVGTLHQDWAWRGGKMLGNPEKERALELVDNRWNQTERWGGVNDGADRIRQEKERWDGSGGHQDKEPGRIDESGKGTW